jgi:GntR family histidine utilization transcriptional repressor
VTLALHEQIRCDIETAILSGKLDPGERLPTEAELQDRYGCSRMTVSKALSALGYAGLIERKKRAGSFVARPRLHSMVLDVPDLGTEIRAKGQAYAYRLHRQRLRAPARDADERALAGQGKLLQLDGVHFADDRPFALERRLVSVVAVPSMADVDFTTTAPGSWLLKHVPWTEAETRIAAVGADARSAEMLGIDAGTPCLALDRQTWRGEEGITAVHQLFPGTTYDLVARFGHRARAA